MNYDIRFRSWRSVLLGALVTLAGIVGAMLSSPWWLLLLPIGATNIFRLERNVAAAMLTELKRSGTPVLVLWPRFYGVAHGRFCRGTVTVPQVASFAEGTGMPAENGPGAGPEMQGMPQKQLTPWMSLAIADIASVDSTSGEKTIWLGLRDRTEEIDCTMPFERDQVLKLLRPACPWTVTSTTRKVFRIDPRSWVLCLPLVLFSMAVALTAVGLLQPHQLPLADWNNIAGIRGKGRGMAVLWVLASQAYRFAVEQCPPVVTGILSVGGAVGFSALLAWLQWRRLTDTTWTHPRQINAGA